MSRRKQPERRTFLQDRFEILIKRQKTGVATFVELTELDDIVNRDPQLREKVIRENLLMDGPDDFNGLNDKHEAGPYLPPVKQKTLLARMKKFLSGIFTKNFEFLQGPLACF